MVVDKVGVVYLDIGWLVLAEYEEVGMGDSVGDNVDVVIVYRDDGM
ncbi:hypothetical protein [Bacillus pumilus]|nr:hypothetical protein [Bacillus pumilus]